MKRLALALIVTVALIGVALGQRERTRWPIPTYTIEIRSIEMPNFPVILEGSFTRPDGKVVEIEHRAMSLPVTFYLNADCSLDLKMTTAERRFRATVFYEHNDVTKWLATADGIVGVGVSFKLKPYGE